MTSSHNPPPPPPLLGNCTRWNDKTEHKQTTRRKNWKIFAPTRCSMWKIDSVSSHHQVRCPSRARSSRLRQWLVSVCVFVWWPASDLIYTRQSVHFRDKSCVAARGKTNPRRESLSFLVENRPRNKRAKTNRSMVTHAHTVEWSVEANSIRGGGGAFVVAVRVALCWRPRGAAAWTWMRGSCSWKFVAVVVENGFAWSGCRFIWSLFFAAQSFP